MSLLRLLTGFPAVAAGSTQLVAMVAWTGDETSDRQISLPVDLSGGGVVIIHVNDGANSRTILNAFDGTTSCAQIFGSTTNNNDYLGWNSSGFVVGTTGKASSVTLTNRNGISYTAYAIKKDPDACDVAFYTGTGASQGISYNVTAPGSILAFRRTTGSIVNWWHRDGGNQDYIQGSTTNAVQTSATIWDSSTPTASGFRVGNNVGTGTNAVNYCAIIFAHDTASDGCVYCGSWTGNGTTSNDVTALVWRPDVLMVRGIAGGRYSVAVDQERTPSFTGADSVARMGPAGVAFDTSTDRVSLASATGFRLTSSGSDWNVNASGYRYIALREART